MTTDPNTTAGADGRPTPASAPLGATADEREALVGESAAAPANAEQDAATPAAQEAPRADGAAAEADAEQVAEPEAEQAAEPEAQQAAEPDYKDLYLRAVAETDNMRKRARRDVAAAESRGLGRLARELLPALDNLDRALAHAEAEEQDEEHHLTKGIRLVQRDLVAALARLGIEAYSPKGEQFDPHHHEAVAQQAVEGAEPGTIVEVYQPGYRCGGEVLRAAKVVVAG
jgi:molecular chaperone GrpE